MVTGSAQAMSSSWGTRRCSQDGDAGHGAGSCLYVRTALCGSRSCRIWRIAAAGTPVAALAWRKGTCAQAALCDNTGTVALISPQADDNAAASVLAGRHRTGSAAQTQRAVSSPRSLNVSACCQIAHTSEHAQILDTWLTALSRLGLHARHLEIYGAARTWHRREVEGITLRIAHDGLEISDIVLLWNASRPSFMAKTSGLGSAAAVGNYRRAWPSVVYGSLVKRADPFVLDTIRAATLIAANGILPNDSNT